MKKSNLAKAASTLMTLSLSLLIIGSQPVHAAFPSPADTTITSAESLLPQPRADIIQWYFKYIGEVLYRRQYNRTTGQWIGDWERVG